MGSVKLSRAKGWSATPSPRSSKDRQACAESGEHLVKAGTTDSETSRPRVPGRERPRSETPRQQGLYRAWREGEELLCGICTGSVFLHYGRKGHCRCSFIRRRQGMCWTIIELDDDAPSGDYKRDGGAGQADKGVHSFGRGAHRLLE